MADPLDTMISTAKMSRMIISGSSQNFFLTLRKSHKSLKNSIYYVFKKVFQGLRLNKNDLV